MNNLHTLRHVVRNHPVIDNHAHNLLLLEKIQSQPFYGVVTEAQGPALEDAENSLPLRRAVRDFQKLYDGKCEDWESMNKIRSQWLQDKPLELIQRCFEGVHTILFDDGLDSGGNVYPFDWHDQFVPGRSKRIVRIEAVAESIMRDEIAPQTQNEQLDVQKVNPWFFRDSFKSFEAKFENYILECIADDDVVGFKTIIAYRTGLAISSEKELREDDQGITKSFSEYMQTAIRQNVYRLNHKVLNDWLVVKLLSILTQNATPKALVKPLQLHTGLGDTDLRLDLADPAHLQPVIDSFPQVPFVLLHSSYPFTRNAGYLATTYKNVYLDLGLVFPMVSRDGQEAILRQSLELSPSTKLLWSSDGHWFGETFWLANKQFRQALEKVLCEYVYKKELSLDQAVQLSKDIFFNNSNKLYGLNASVEKDENSGNTSSIIIGQNTTLASATAVSDLELLHNFDMKYPTLSFIYVQWIDYMGQMRVRVLKSPRFYRAVEDRERVGISRGNIGTLQNDTWTPVVNTAGQIYLKLSLNSLRPTHRFDTLRTPDAQGNERVSATIMAGWCDEAGEDIPDCCRGTLSRIVSDIESNFNMELWVGFEVEVTFLRRDGENSYTPYTSQHNYTTMSPQQWHGLGLLQAISDGLEDIGVDIEQLHAEAAPGQYEFILPPLPAVDSVDMLYQARQVIQQIAHARGLRATFHPQPLPGIGTAAHANISLNASRNEKEMEMDFFGGVMSHLYALCGLLLPQAVSYKRVVDDSWTGGTWVAWGSQNRETPVRRVREGLWEIRCLDGTANMYLALAGVLAAGWLGLCGYNGMELKDCPSNPSHLKAAQRAEYGIKDKMPADIEKSLAALRKAEDLQEVLGKQLVQDYLSMKRVEQDMIQNMPATKRHAWLIERY